MWKYCRWAFSRRLQSIVLVIVITCLSYYLLMQLYPHMSDSTIILPIYHNHSHHYYAIDNNEQKITSIKHELIVMKNIIRQQMKFAWDNYRKYAWGSNELYSHPSSPRPHTGADGLVGTRNGLTIIDSLGTLYLMEMFREFNISREWVATEFAFCKTTTPVSVFEVTIRLLGGLLSAFSLSNDVLFAEKAVEVAECLGAAFDADGGLPTSFIIPGRHSLRPGRSSNKATSLADAGSLDLEFVYLSDITGVDRYKNWVGKARRALLDFVANSDNGIIGNSITGSDASLGGGGDSFYEYQVKHYIYNPNRQDLNVFVKLLSNAQTYLITKYSNYICVSGASSSCAIEHLSCFAGGMYALAASITKSKEWWHVAQEITKICYTSYSASSIGIGKEQFSVDNGGSIVDPSNGRYILRPEVVESIYYMFYFTDSRIYRDQGRAIVSSFMKHLRLPYGYSGVSYSMTNGKVDKEYDYVQQSFFVAETLKYLYMLFQEKHERLSLDEWVFTTEAHPLPVFSSARMNNLQLKHQKRLNHYAQTF